MNKETKTNIEELEKLYGCKTANEFYRIFDIPCIFTWNQKSTQELLDVIEDQKIATVSELSKSNLNESEYADLIRDIMSDYGIANIFQNEPLCDLIIDDYIKDNIINIITEISRDMYKRQCYKNLDNSISGFRYDKVLDLYSYVFDIEPDNISLDDKPGRINYLAIPSDWNDTLCYIVSNIPDTGIESYHKQLISQFLSGTHPIYKKFYDFRGRKAQMARYLYTDETLQLLLCGKNKYNNRYKTNDSSKEESLLSEILNRFNMKSVDSLCGSIEMAHIFGFKYLKAPKDINNVYELFISNKPTIAYAEDFKRPSSSSTKKDKVDYWFKLDRVGIYYSIVKNKWKFDLINNDRRMRLITFLDSIREIEGKLRYDYDNEIQNILNPDFSQEEYFKFKRGKSRKVLEFSISSLNLNEITETILRDNGITMVSDIVNTPADELYSYFNRYEQERDLNIALIRLGIYVKYNGRTHKRVVTRTVHGAPCFACNGYWIPTKYNNVSDKVLSILYNKVLAGYITIKDLFSYIGVPADLFRIIDKDRASMAKTVTREWDIDTSIENYNDLKSKLLESKDV